MSNDMNFKVISFSLDALKENFSLRKTVEEFQASTVPQSIPRTTIFTLGQDSRVNSFIGVPSPDIYLSKVELDGLKNPLVTLYWKISKKELGCNKILGFEVYRRKIASTTVIEDSNLSTPTAVEKVSRGIKRFGKFSEQKKSIFNFERSIIPQNYLNLNLANEKASSKSRAFTDLNDPSNAKLRSQIESLRNREFNKIAFIDYSKFIADYKNMQVYIEDINYIDTFYSDIAVGYGEVYEYYVKTILQTYEESSNSNIVKVNITNLSPISKPLSLICKQRDENSISLLCNVDPKDDIYKINIFKRNEKDLNYQKIAELENLNDFFEYVDVGLEYNKEYFYRIFAENIYGTTSEPIESKLYLLSNNVTSKSKLNSLKDPILNSIQDQNSDDIKITISPNDPNILHYELSRRDLTIYEKQFTVPSSYNTHYGAESAWDDNKFFVKNKINFDTNQILDLIKQGKEIDNFSQTISSYAEAINFKDSSVQRDHVYQYRIIGFDRFGNQTSSAIQTIRSIGKKSIRSPINLSYEVLRKFPLRLKIKWTDDNTFSTDKQSKIKYTIQRRKYDESINQEFPITLNNFIIDEVGCSDYVSFSQDKIEDTFGTLKDDFNKLDKNKDRPFEQPDFLQENYYYYYKIMASIDNEQSNFSEELEVSTYPDVSNPIDFVANYDSTFSPIFVKLSWQNELNKLEPDYWIIERKIDSSLEIFNILGKSYIDKEYLDIDIKKGYTYLYRIRSVDALGRKSNYFETRINIL